VIAAEATAAVLRDLFDLRGTRAVVTGAASGLGLAFSEILADCGAAVMMADIRGDDELASAAAPLAARGCEVRTCTCDVAHEGSVGRLFEEARSAMGGVDVVFANAGITGGPGFLTPEGQLDTIDLEQWQRVIDVDMTGVMLTLRAAARLMKPQRRGRIVVTASIAGLAPEPFVGYSYVCAKAAVVNLVHQAALELAPHQVTVNAIAPGPFRTNIAGGRLHDEEAAKRWAATVPLGRMGQPSEIKGLALFLASPASAFMTGAVVPIDGGSVVAGKPIMTADR